MPNIVHIYRQSSGSDPPIPIYADVAEFYGLQDGDTVSNDALPAVLSDVSKFNQMYIDVYTAKNRGAIVNEQFGAILNSLINGQRRQMVNQMDELGMYDFPELLSWVADDMMMPDKALDMAISYFRIKGR